MRLTWIVATTLIIAGAFASGARAEEGIPDARAQALEALRKESAVPPQVRFEGGIVRFAQIQIQVPVQDKDPERAAAAFLADHRELYGIEDTDSFYVRRVIRDESGDHVFLGQRRDDVRVLDAELSIHIRDGEVIATAGAYVPELPASTEPAVTAESAKARAAKAAGRKATTAGEPRLAFYAPGLLNPEKTPVSRLIWRITTVNDAGAIEHYVDAINGKVLKSIATARDAKHLAIGSNNNGGEFGCAFLSHSGWFNENGTLPGATPDTEGFKAFTNANSIYDFWRNQLGRDSWDGLGGGTRDELDDGASAGNAAYIPFCGHFVFGDNMSALDVMAHEFTHGVVDKTAHLSNGDHQNALHESYGDVFASVIDGNWTIGEGTPGGAFRSLSNPPTFGDPDRMTQFMPGGDPHANGGITNKAAFLIAMGGTQNGVTVSGIGRTKLADLYYDVLTTWLPSNATFNLAADLTTTAATVAATTGRHGFTRADACVVGNAFAAVELRAPDLDCDGNPDALDPDDDNDTIADTADNCPAVSNPGQADSDGDGRGDACDNDADNDGVANTSDNCRMTPNPAQADINRDGIGDACSDLDADGVKDATDNCVFNRNAGQEDRDGDHIGDACDDDDDGDGVRDIADNCRMTANASQADGDADGVGDACDGCPVNANVGDGPDGDGIDSACDPDDDNDGVLDGSDNCPSVANAGQTDINRNGIGTACDPTEMITVDPHTRFVLGDPRFRLEREQVIHLPIRLLWPEGCDWSDPGCLGEIRVDTVFDTAVRIVDDSGAVIAQDVAGRAHVLRFAPGGDAILRRPGGDRVEGPNGQRFWLDIAGTGDRGPKPGREPAVVIATGP
jgi:Zn-dependent metalloprotease